MRIDSHQHFWQYTPREYPWIGKGMEHLRCDFLPDDLMPLLQTAGLERSIAVQARQDMDESRWLLELAKVHAVIAGVVAWVDLRSNRMRHELEELCEPGFLVGVRHVVQNEPDDDFLIRPDFVRGIKTLAEFGLTYDILIFPHQLPAAIKLVNMLPDQPFVLDHIAKPRIVQKLMDPWRAQIKELAASPNVMCKISGMVTEAKWRAWRPADFRPYLDVVTEAFGYDRLMFGSDWPVCLAAAEYAEVVDLVRNYYRAAPKEAQQQIFGDNAARFYGIEEQA